ncbi:hypothetical protein Dimus_033247 [Dionaea muscipula]
MENNFNEQLCMLYLSLVFAYHHLFTTVIVAISTSAYVSALHSHLHFFHQSRSTPPSSSSKLHHHQEKNPLAAAHISTFTPPSPRPTPLFRRLVGSTPSKKDNNHQPPSTIIHRRRQTHTSLCLPPPLHHRHRRHLHLSHMFPLYIPISISFTSEKHPPSSSSETPSSPRKEPTRRCPHINLHATITETNTTFPPPSLVQRQVRRTTTTSHLPPSSIADDNSHQVDHPSLFLSTP